MSKYYFLGITVVTMLGNYLTNTPLYVGKTIGELSDIYTTLLTPAGVTFAIWGVIYTGLLYVGYLYARGRLGASREVLPWYALSAGLNVGWLVTWGQEWLGVAAVVLVALALVNFRIVQLLTRVQDEYPQGAVGVQVYLVYAAWTLLASLISVTTYLQYTLSFDGLDYSGATWVNGILWAVGALTVYLVVRKNYLALAAVYLWALYGIILAQGAEIATQAAFVGGVVALVTGVTVSVRRRLRVR